MFVENPQWYFRLNIKTEVNILVSALYLERERVRSRINKDIKSDKVRHKIEA